MPEPIMFCAASGGFTPLLPASALLALLRYILTWARKTHKENLMKGVIFTGLQASGKSSFYLSSFYKTHIRLNMDMLKTRHRENILFNACLVSKQPVVIDNTNPTRQEREKYIHGFKKYRFEVIGYYFTSSLGESLKRNALREGKECVPEVGVRATYKKLQLPQYNEGFDQLYVVTMTNSGFTLEKIEEVD